MITQPTTQTGRAPSSLPKYLQATRQKIIPHAAGYVFTAADIERVLNGKEFHITGAAVQKAYLACDFFHPDEISWSWVVDPANPHLVCDLVVYEGQEVSPAHCEASGLAVIRARREARPRETVGAGHTHTRNGGLFSSPTDVARAARLVASRYSWSSEMRARCKGRVRPPDASDLATTADDAGYFPIEFETPPAGLKLRVRSAEPLPNDLEFEAEWIDVRRDVSTFTTHNAQGLYVPIITRDSCPQCGGLIAQSMSADIEIHIHHPAQLTHDEKARAMAEYEKKSPQRHYYQSWRKSTSPWQQRAAWADQPEVEPSCQKGATAVSLPPADYVLSRNGLTWRVAPALMEEAASRVPALAQLLWPEDGGMPEAAPVLELPDLRNPTASPDQEI